MISKRLKSHEELRKLAHISIGLGLAVGSLFLDRWVIVLALVIGLLIDIVLRWKSHWLHNLIDVGRRSYGDYSYVVGIALSAIIFTNDEVFLAAILVLALSDGLAGLLGRLYGTHHFSFLAADKTILGSTVFFATSFFIISLVLANTNQELSIILAQAFGISGLLTVTEALIGWGLDNFAVPLATGFLLTLVV